MCNQVAQIHHAHGSVMGGPWQLRHVPVAGVTEDDVANAALAAMQRVDAQMSNYRADSDLMRLNTAPLDMYIDIPADMFTVMARAQHFARLSGGTLNIALGRLVNLWGFGPDKTPAIHPEISTLKEQAALAALGGFALRPHPPAVIKNADICFDLCALAKGFAVDQAARAVEALGVQNFLIEAAGEVFARGHANSTPWRVGLELPVPGKEHLVFDELELDGRGIATTGNYRNHRQIEGMSVSHTIDPTTGAPLYGDLLSVSVLDETCMDADALATVLFVLGSKKGPEFADQNKIAALFLIREADGLREIRSLTFMEMTT